MEDFARYEKGARTHLGKTVVRVSNANQKHLDETKDRLGDTEKELSITKSQLSEQNLLRKAHQETEDRLNAICNELKGTLESTTADLRGYQEKLGICLFVFKSDFPGRKAQVEEENKTQWKNVQQDLTTLASSLDNRFQTMSSFQLSKSSDMEKMIASFLDAEAKHLDEIHHFVDSQLSLFEQQQRHFESDLSDAKTSGDVILGEIKDVREDIKRKVAEGLTTLNAASEDIGQGIVDAMVDFQQEVFPSRLSI
jgi:kinesin family member 11